MLACDHLWSHANQEQTNSAPSAQHRNQQHTFGTRRLEPQPRDEGNLRLALSVPRFSYTKCTPPDHFQNPKGGDSYPISAPLEFARWGNSCADHSLGRSKLH